MRIPHTGYALDVGCKKTGLNNLFGGDKCIIIQAKAVGCSQMAMIALRAMCQFHKLVFGVRFTGSLAESRSSRHQKRRHLNIMVSLASK